ncbi:hypothetical protein SAMN03159341_13237 [Paenibacillus sp. 1_12]|uniref:hypothetical protein n=1 Tax=Paenibacillus sp. 1_12 TaxID=1566278 RepID=UPI0008EC77F2|nr:hypothetical protein [Paenibacillus sp. 1_12]SFM42461.1 hypothetical protein SAMN03159341_13237 [Paenibacillus sp. 1_12]
MKKLMSKAMVSVMYSQRTWDLFKTGVWFVGTLVVWSAFFVLAVTTSLLLALNGVQFNYELSESLVNMLLFSSFIVAGSIAYFRSLSYKPEEKIQMALKKD